MIVGISVLRFWDYKKLKRLYFKSHDGTVKGAGDDTAKGDDDICTQRL